MMWSISSMVLYSPIEQTQRAVLSDLMRQTEREQNVAGVRRAEVHAEPDDAADALGIQQEQQALALYALKHMLTVPGT